MAPHRAAQTRPLSGPGLRRRLLAEFLGTGLLATAVIGSGIMAVRLAPGQAGLQLLANSLATVFALGALILMFGPVSGAHFNPVVSAADWWLGRRTATGLTPAELAAYTGVQVLGAIGGAVLTNAMFGLPAVTAASHVRTGRPLWLGELVATTGLLLLITALARSQRTALARSQRTALARSQRTAVAPAAVAAWIGGAYWFTSSTSFANPAVTLGRAFSDTFAGIAPASVAAFIAAQLVGLLLALALTAVLYPADADVHAEGPADDLVVPHHDPTLTQRSP